MADPYQIDGPALISFSGGRSSAYMLWHIVQAHGGTLPDDIKVCFANTGKEMPQTLDFVRDCGERWDVEVVWLEFQPGVAQQRWRRVDYATASRAGEPFEAMIDQKKLLPGPTARFCTIDLKVRPMKLYAQQALGWKYWTNVIGMRADEQRRVAKARERGAHGPEPWDNDMPLAEAGVTKQDVNAFWRGQNFDLALPSINNKTPHGNCDLCFLKSAATLSAIMRDMPERATWWIAQEERMKAIAYGNGRRFRNDRPAYAQMFEAVQNQEPFDFGNIDELNDCLCGA